MKVYLAAQYKQKEEMKGYARELEEAGIEVTSRWLKEPHSTEAALGELNPEDLRIYALIDLQDIDAADVFVFFSLSDTALFSRGGRHAEFGYALCENLPILVIGPKENIFHYIDGVYHVEGWEDAKNRLSRMQAADVMRK